MRGRSDRPPLKRTAFRAVAIDFSPLRDSRDFRLLWIGQLVGNIGRQITVVALPYQVFLITRSSLMVGLLALAQAGPLVVFSLAGGAIAAAADPRRQPPSADAARPGWHALVEGFTYLRTNRPVLGSFAVDLNAMIFGMPRALFPALATDTFKVGATGLGLLHASVAAGALVGALMTGWVSRIRRQGAAVLWAVAGWGAAILAFGLCRRAFWLGLVFLAMAGAA